MIMHTHHDAKQNNFLISVATDCADAIGITIEEMQGRSRLQEVVLARQFFCAIARSKGYSFRYIGDFINRDHATTLYSMNKIKDNIAAGDLLTKKVSQRLSSYEEELKALFSSL